jgi:hypothetical protein
MCSLGWPRALTHAASFFGKNLVAVRGTQLGMGNGSHARDTVVNGNENTGYTDEKCHMCGRNGNGNTGSEVGNRPVRGRMGMGMIEPGMAAYPLPF